MMVQRDFDFASMESVLWNYRFHPQSQTAKAAIPLAVSCFARYLSVVQCSVCMTVLECLNEQLPVDIGAIKRGLLLVENPGRFQVSRPSAGGFGCRPQSARSPCFAPQPD